MSEGVPRVLLALTTIVVLAAVYVGIKDYLQKPKETQPTASAVLSVAQSNAAPVHKKISSAKLRHVRMSANAANTADAPEDTEKPFIGQQSSEADAKAPIVNDYAPNTVGAQAAHDQADAAKDRRTRAGDELKTNVLGSAFSGPPCIPLPNLVMRGDVDAQYYENWAREYSCLLR